MPPKAMAPPSMDTSLSMTSAPPVRTIWVADVSPAKVIVPGAIRPLCT